MSAPDEPVQQLQSLLDELNDEIDVLTKRVENGGADVRDEIEQLRARQIEVRSQLEATRAAPVKS